MKKNTVAILLSLVMLLTLCACGAGSSAAPAATPEPTPEPTPESTPEPTPEPQRPSAFEDQGLADRVVYLSDAEGQSYDYHYIVEENSVDAHGTVQARWLALLDDHHVFRRTVHLVEVGLPCHHQYGERAQRFHQ